MSKLVFPCINNLLNFFVDWAGSGVRSWWNPFHFNWLLYLILYWARHNKCNAAHVTPQAFHKRQNFITTTTTRKSTYFSQLALSDHGGMGWNFGWVPGNVSPRVAAVGDKGQKLRQITWPPDQVRAFWGLRNLFNYCNEQRKSVRGGFKHIPGKKGTLFYIFLFGFFYSRWS